MDELLLRQMPHSTEAEQAVLGSMLIDAACVKDVMDQLQPDDFYLRQNREIFETIYTMFVYSRPIDGLTVAGELEKAGLANDGTRAYLAQLMEVTPTSANVLEYVRLVREKALLRSVAAAAEELKQYRLEGTQEQIPLLEEVLPLFQGKTPLIIELKAERGNHAQLAEATCTMLDRFRVNYCIESFDPRCILWLKKHRPLIIRGQLSEQFLRHGESGGGHGRLTMWLLGNLLTNVATQPDFIAYRFSDRENLCLRLCHKVYHVQEVNWTIRAKEEMEAAEQAGNLVIFECFDPEV